MARLRFRNLDVRPTDPVADWGVEGILTAIDRGSLPDWQRVVASIGADPWGPVAADLEEALQLAEDRGVAATLTRALADARESVMRAAREEVQRRLAALVSASGLTSAQFAARLGTSPSRMSTYLTGKVVPSAALMVRAEAIASATR
jgi:hypothetical protein